MKEKKKNLNLHLTIKERVPHAGSLHTARRNHLSKKGIASWLSQILNGFAFCSKT